MTRRDTWRRVSKSKRCPICDRPDWCLLSSDGDAVLCARVESAKRCGEAGWLHRLCDDDRPRPRRIVRTIPMTTAGPRLDLAAIAATYRAAINIDALSGLARSLGVSVASLTALRVGWSADHESWAFPMGDANGNVVGIRLRRPNGSKFSVTGGKEGLFLTTASSADQRMVICEGPTDAAALLDLRYTSVIGRPSCTGGIRLLVDLVQQRRPDEAVIVADADLPGRRGADNLASVLLAYVPAVRVVVPTQFKDVRDFVRGGGKRQQLEQAIALAQPRRLKVRAFATKRNSHDNR
jgi:phage/plasmid primase-like uncharacterized protein